MENHHAIHGKTHYFNGHRKLSSPGLGTGTCHWPRGDGAPKSIRQARVRTAICGEKNSLDGE